jgi:hypothetical protein
MQRAELETGGRPAFSGLGPLTMNSPISSPIAMTDFQFPMKGPGTGRDRRLGAVTPGPRHESERGHPPAVCSETRDRIPPRLGRGVGKSHPGETPPIKAMKRRDSGSSSSRSPHTPLNATVTSGVDIHPKPQIPSLTWPLLSQRLRGSQTSHTETPTANIEYHTPISSSHGIRRRRQLGIRAAHHGADNGLRSESGALRNAPAPMNLEAPRDAPRQPIPYHAQNPS